MVEPNISLEETSKSTNTGPRSAARFNRIFLAADKNTSTLSLNGCNVLVNLINQSNEDFLGSLKPML